MELDGQKRQVHADTRWRAWAEAHACSYEEDMPSLIGVWFPPFDGMERYNHVIGGRWQGIGFWSFSRATWNRPLFGNTGHTWRADDYLFVQLPGALPAEILSMTPAKAFDLLGGRLPTAYDFKFRGADWLEARTPRASVEGLEGTLANLALQLNAAPPSLWLH